VEEKKCKLKEERRFDEREVETKQQIEYWCRYRTK
jgi:hypothetical protein